MLGYEPDEFDVSVAVARVRAARLRVPVGIWVPDPNRNGYSTYAGPRPIAAVVTELKAALRDAMGDHYATEWWNFDKTAGWPGQGEILVSVGEGSNEGHFLRIMELTRGENDRLTGSAAVVVTVKLLQEDAIVWDMVRLVDMILRP